MEIREKLAVPKDLWGAAIGELVSRPCIQEAAVLSTCNRMEVGTILNPQTIFLPRYFIKSEKWDLRSWCFKKYFFYLLFLTISPSLKMSYFIWSSKGGYFFGKMLCWEGRLPSESSAWNPSLLTHTSLCATDNPTKPKVSLGLDFGCFFLGFHSWAVDTFSWTLGAKRLGRFRLNVVVVGSFSKGRSKFHLILILLRLSLN